jgi:hypothetical protein
MSRHHAKAFRAGITFVLALSAPRAIYSLAVPPHLPVLPDSVIDRQDGPRDRPFHNGHGEDSCCRVGTLFQMMTSCLSSVP